MIDAYREKLGIDRFDLTIDWGWFSFFTKPMFWLLEWLYVQLGNFGVSILILTVIVKAIFFPLANKSYAAMSKMKALQPEMEKLKERYGEDKQRMNQELMQLYRREKVNPAAGCLPIVVQIPVFFALYKVLYTTIEMRHQPFFGWIKDLSAPDPLTILTGFGLFHWQVPEFLHFFNIGIWPLIMGVTMYLQQKLNPAPTDPVQARVFQFLPIMFTFMLAPFAAGLVIYWAWSNTLSIAQQYTIMRRHGTPIGGKAQARRGPAVPAPAPAPADGGGGGGKKGGKGGEEALMPDQKQRARAGRDRGGAQALRRPVRVRGRRGLARVAARDLAARGRLRRPLQRRQVEPGQCADRPAHAGAHLVQPGPYAADQFLRPRPAGSSWSTCRATASPRSRGR